MTHIAKSRAGYVLILEKTRTGYCCHAPDVLACVATGRTLVDTKRLMEGALKIHIRGTREDGLPVQRPRSLAELRRRRLLSGVN